MMTVLLPTLLQSSVEYAWHVLQLLLCSSVCKTQTVVVICIALLTVPVLELHVQCRGLQNQV